MADLEKNTDKDFNSMNMQADEGVVEAQLEETIIKTRRVAKVVKGGRRFSFSVLVAVGDKDGRIGIGFGKANEVSDAISKASQNAKKNMQKIYLTKRKTVPHEIIGEFKGSKVIIRPAAPGTGVIAGGAVRAVLELSGVENILSKSLGSKSPLNAANATLNALKSLRKFKDVAMVRGITVKEMLGQK